jgi:hypothetical protein
MFDKTYGSTDGRRTMKKARRATRDIPQGMVDAGVSVVRLVGDVADSAVKRVRSSEPEKAIQSTSSKATHEHSGREEGSPPVILTAAQTEQLSQMGASPAPSKKGAAKRTAKARKVARA